jgi:hypothetical protein
MYQVHRFLWILFCAGLLKGQITQLDLHFQSRDVDFSSAAATKPFKSGTIFPSTCSVGEMFFKTDAPAGVNLFGCTSLNAWTLEQSSSPSVTGNSGKVLTTDGATLLFSSLGGDISGPATAISVTQLQGRPVSSAAPASGQALAWNATSSRWEPQTISGGAQGPGASMASQLGDFAVTRSSATVLAIGANCAATTPCIVRFGNLVYSFASGGTVSITAGTGLAYMYVSSAGTLTVGHNVTASCGTGCTAQSGITSFPSDAIPLFTWSATSGNWDAAGGVDQRAVFSSKSILAGAGLTSAESSGKTTVAVDSTLVGLHASVPGTSSSACTTGAWAMDTSFYYICVSTNVWRRAALASF